DPGDPRRPRDRMPRLRDRSGYRIAADQPALDVPGRWPAPNRSDHLRRDHGADARRERTRGLDPGSPCLAHRSRDRVAGRVADRLLSAAIGLAAAPASHLTGFRGLRKSSPRRKTMPNRRTPEGIGRRDFARLSLGTLGAAALAGQAG